MQSNYSPHDDGYRAGATCIILISNCPALLVCQVSRLLATTDCCDHFLFFLHPDVGGFPPAAGSIGVEPEIVHLVFVHGVQGVVVL